MALIKTGSIDDFSVGILSEIKSEQQEILMDKLHSKGVELSNYKDITTVRELKEISQEIPSELFQFVTSEPRGLALKSLLLTKNFDTYLRGVLNPTNEIYFIAWAWDLSGEAVYNYPGSDVNPEDMVFQIKAGNIREFIGEGINLFPKRKVTGGMAVRIHIWESDQKSRKFGELLQTVVDSIQKSKLNNLLSLVGLVTGVPGTTVSLIKDAALELAGVVGTILKSNSNDHVDFFEGYYATDQEWKIGEDVYSGNASVLTLNKY
ncbi:hypothetical protein [Sphingobacterium hotanense]|uniref:hypothetical protein n=1 Tax=Sphingobacterium TaxID=28453 RepID=UPI0021A6CB87|nr:hypothetical protein [Sphingobacterium hotanense]MCT1523680.1 hypothetical protein [Sphingobacterium hotanense]